MFSDPTIAPVGGASTGFVFEKSVLVLTRLPFGTSEPKTSGEYTTILNMLRFWRKSLVSMCPSFFSENYK